MSCRRYAHEVVHAASDLDLELIRSDRFSNKSLQIELEWRFIIQNVASAKLIKPTELEKL